ncbi:MAG: RsmG family class I SAM-dependent methyltransferase, partial [Acidimicrobiales bacterium]
MLGPGPVMDHIRQAESFVTVAAGGPARALDLGAGAGVPGLVLAVWWPSSAWVLLEGSRRRVALLEA